MSMRPDLEWLARNVSEWPEPAIFIKKDKDFTQGFVISERKDLSGRHNWTNYNEWLQARQLLGLESPEVTEAEDEAWQAMEEKQSRQKYSAYFKDVRHLDYIDVYRTVSLFDCEKHGHAISHAAKKLLLTGVRTGGKNVEQEVQEAIDTLTRWLEMKREDASALRAGELGE